MPGIRHVAEGVVTQGDILVGATKKVGGLDLTSIPQASGVFDVDTLVADLPLGEASGIATLDAGGKIPAAQLPNSIMDYNGTWAASTNTPALANGTGNAGDVYVASDAGTVNFGAGNITFAAGDWVIYSGLIWEKSVNSNAVATVNGYTGAVVLNAADVGADAAGVASGLVGTHESSYVHDDIQANTNARHAAATVVTTNGLSILGQEISLGLAATGATGALSSTDWNTFNGKVNKAGDTMTGDLKILSSLESISGKIILGNNFEGFESSATLTYDYGEEMFVFSKSIQTPYKIMFGGNNYISLDEIYLTGVWMENLSVADGKTIDGVDISTLPGLIDAKADKVGAVDIEITDATKGVILKDANGNRRRLTVSIEGVLIVSDPLV